MYFPSTLRDSFFCNQLAMKKTSLRKLLSLISASLIPLGGIYAAPQQVDLLSSCHCNGCELVGVPIETAVQIENAVPTETEAPSQTGMPLASNVLSGEVIVESTSCCGAGESIVIAEPSYGTSGMSLDLNVLLTGQVNELKDTVEGLRTENERLVAASSEMEAQLAELEKGRQELIALREAKAEWENSQKSMAESMTAKDEQISNLQAEIASLGEADTLASASDKAAGDEESEEADDADETESSDAPPVPEEPTPQQPAARNEGDQPAEDDSLKTDETDSDGKPEQPAAETPAE